MVFSTKVNYALPLPFNDPQVLSSTTDKAKMFTENIFNINSNLDQLGISLPAFFSRTNLKLYDVSGTAKLV